MKNLKKIALSLLVVGLAVGSQSFKNAEKSSSLLSTIYYQISPGVYSKTTPPVTERCIEDDNPCTLQFPNTIPSGQFDTFDYGTELSAVTALGGSPTPSGNDGVWQ